MSIFDSIVITGGYGMLANALLRKLAQRKLSVHAVDRDVCDITRESDVASLFQSARPTLLINCAAHTKVDQCEDEEAAANAINGTGVGLLAAACKKSGAMLVHFSTDFVFDGQGKRPYRSDDPVGPVSAYGRSKLLGEQKLQEHAPDKWLILRTAWLYGRNGPNFPRTIVERGKAGQPLKVVDDQIGSPTYTEDLAAATLELIELGKNGIWHLSNSGQTSWFEFARAALEEFGVKAEVAPTTTAQWLAIRPKQARRPAYSVLDVSPFEKATGHPMRPWREALRDYARAVKQEGF